MAASAIAQFSNLLSPASSTTPASSSSTGTLGQADFMKLLVAQMQNQDPLNPISNTDFTAQLAQFSSLQGIQGLNSTLASMLSLQQLTQGANLIGKTVVYTKPNSKITQQGVVNSVQMSNGQLQLMVNNTAVPITQVQSVQNPGQ